MKKSTTGRMPKLTKEQATRARDWAAIGTSMVTAAAHFGVSPRALRATIRGEHKRAYRTEKRPADSVTGKP